MVLIEIKKEDQEEAFKILLTNGMFRAFGENMFDIVEHGEEIIEKLNVRGVPYKILSRPVVQAQQQ